MKRLYLLLLLLPLLLVGCKTQKALSNKEYTQQANSQVYQPQKRQFRGAWIPNAWRGEFQGKSTQ